MSLQRVTNLVPPVRRPPSRQALPPRLQHLPPSLHRSHRARGRAPTLLRCLSHHHQLKMRKGEGSHHCHHLQAAESPRCERRRLEEVLRRRLELLRNLQEVERDQVEEREVEEAFLTRSPGLRAFLSSKLPLCNTLHMILVPFCLTNSLYSRREVLSPSWFQS